MTIEQLKQAQTDLSQSIRTLIVDFETSTGLTPEVQVYRIAENGTLYVEVKTEIKGILHIGVTTKTKNHEHL